MKLWTLKVEPLADRTNLHLYINVKAGSQYDAGPRICITAHVSALRCDVRHDAQIEFISIQLFFCVAMCCDAIRLAHNVKNYATRHASHRDTRPSVVS